MSDSNPTRRQQDFPSARLLRWMGLFYIALPLFLVYLLFKVFPRVPWPQAPDNSTDLPIVPITFLGGWVQVATTWEERLLLLVIVAGALGSYIHAATSFADYVGNKKFYASWKWWYLLRPFIGIALALVLYFVVRGGFLLLVSGGQPTADDINPFGIGALAGLVGMFSKQATDKLDEVFSTLFKPAPGKGDDKRGDSLTGAVSVQAIDKQTGPTVGGDSVTLTGTGFAEGAKVFFGDQQATDVVVVSTTSITAKTPSQAAGTVDVTVTNPDTQSAALKSGYTYVDGGDGAGAGAGAGGGAGARPSIVVSPAFGAPEGGEEVAISGAGFAEGAAVFFGETQAPSVTFMDPTTLTAVTPPGAAGKVQVTVRNPDGTTFTLPAGESFEYTTDPG